MRPTPAPLTNRVTREPTDTKQGATIWFTGLPASGKSTVARLVAPQLQARGWITCTLDGDDMREGLNRDLGFSETDRNENIRRISEVSKLLARAGVIALVPAISPYRKGRDVARRIHSDAGLVFLEVFVDAPVELCKQRDPKGLYARARAGELEGLTGVGAP